MAIAIAIGLIMDFLFFSLYNFFTDIGLFFASKSRIIATTRALAAAVKALVGQQGVQVLVAGSAPDLGLGQRGGRARPQPNARARREAARKRALAIQKLHARGIAHSLFVTGPFVADAPGHRVGPSQGRERIPRPRPEPPAALQGPLQLQPTRAW